MGNTRLKQRRLPKKPQSSSQKPGRSQKITLKLPGLGKKTRESSKPQLGLNLVKYEGNHDPEVDELAGDMELFVESKEEEGGDVGEELESEEEEMEMEEEEKEEEMEEEEEEMEEEEMEEEEMEEEEEDVVVLEEEDVVVQEEEGEEEVEEEERPKPRRAVGDKNFVITFLVPKEKGLCKPFEMDANRSWFSFRNAVARMMSIKRFELSLSYRFSNAKPSAPYQTLDDSNEFGRMVKSFGEALKRSRKGKSSLSIQLKSQNEPDKPKAIVKCKKTGRKPTVTNNKDSDSNGDNGDWRIVGKLRQKYLGCAEHPETPCYLTNDGVHHPLSMSDLSTWATVISHHKATLDEPPVELKLTDRPVKPHGSLSKQPGPVAQSSVGLSTDPASLAALVAAVVAGVTQNKGTVPTQTAEEPKDTANTLDVSTLDGNLEFPSLREWLESIQDIQPRLCTYVDALEAQGLTHLNHLDNNDLTLPVLMEICAMQFVDASALLRMGCKASQEFRDMFKK
ncbi:hypothetical protein CTheo_8842 [Ceratobasidium theobromae]|uniref:Uncharacterized protein n=1 Tax=Ceratobasidium theobromae TaxID=1582974 RepID=A0A5N5Q8J1_9AGAM|nr:hypothetical protein CTheo_8842 [Ceratobasidium theobromae]